MKGKITMGHREDGEKFKIETGPVSPADALKFAAELESAIGEIANGKRKPQNLPIDSLARLIQFTRDEVARNASDKAPPFHPRDERAHLFVQEGGSSGELYIHSHDTFEEAEKDRINCSVNGSYRTGPIIGVHTSLVSHPDFYEVAEAIAKNVLELGYPEFEEDDDDDNKGPTEGYVNDVPLPGMKG